MIKILSQINIQTLLDEYRRLEKDIQWTEYGHKGKQAGLQYKLDEDPWSSAVGRSKGNELEYTKINPFFKNTIFELFINHYNFKRTRLMWVGPYACYSMHTDSTPRIHIPLITNPECYFVFQTGTLTNLTKDHVWWVDTTKAHTFMNCSKEHRLHLVGAVDAAN
jgi:hypothetical protein